MNITALTAPTRGPDYSLPVADRGIPSVTAPTPTSAVMVASPSIAMTYDPDNPAEAARRKKLAPIAVRGAVPRPLTATRRASLPLLLERPISHVSPHQAAQAYQAQRHSDDATNHLSADGAYEATAPFAIQVTEERGPPATLSDSPPVSALYASGADTNGSGLDVIV